MGHRCTPMKKRILNCICTGALSVPHRWLDSFRSSPTYHHGMLSRPTIPGLLVTGTDTGIGKTVVAGAIAAWFGGQGSRVGVLKPIASGCVRRREGLVSEDAELLAHCA